MQKTTNITSSPTAIRQQKALGKLDELENVLNQTAVVRGIMARPDSAKVLNELRATVITLQTIVGKRAKPLVEQIDSLLQTKRAAMLSARFSKTFETLEETWGGEAVIDFLGNIANPDQIQSKKQVRIAFEIHQLEQQLNQEKPTGVLRFIRENAPDLEAKIQKQAPHLAKTYRRVVNEALVRAYRKTAITPNTVRMDHFERRVLDVLGLTLTDAQRKDHAKRLNRYLQSLADPKRRTAKQTRHLEDYTTEQMQTFLEHKTRSHRLVAADIRGFKGARRTRNNVEIMIETTQKWRTVVRAAAQKIGMSENDADRLLILVLPQLSLFEDLGEKISLPTKQWTKTVQATGVSVEIRKLVATQLQTFLLKKRWLKNNASNHRFETHQQGDVGLGGGVCMGWTAIVQQFRAKNPAADEQELEDYLRSLNVDHTLNPPPLARFLQAQYQITESKGGTDPETFASKRLASTANDTDEQTLFTFKPSAEAHLRAAHVVEKLNRLVIEQGVASSAHNSVLLTLGFADSAHRLQVDLDPQSNTFGFFDPNYGRFTFESLDAFNKEFTRYIFFFYGKFTGHDIRWYVPQATSTLLTHSSVVGRLFRRMKGRFKWHRNLQIRSQRLWKRPSPMRKTAAIRK